MIELEHKHVKTYVLAGNATITLQSGKTGKHFTYRIKKHKENHDLYFIYSLVGEDNTKDYRYIGCYFTDNNYLHLVPQYRSISDASCPPSIRAIKFLFKDLNNIHEQLHVFQSGRCARCGRLLTTPESIKRGLGPECEANTELEMLGIEYRRNM